MAIADHPHSSKNARETQWPELLRRIEKTTKRRNVGVLWPELVNTKPTDLADALCWGLDAGGWQTDSAILAAHIAAGHDIQDLHRRDPAFSIAGHIETFLDRIAAGPLDIGVLAEGVAWAYAMPNLAVHFVSDIVQSSELPPQSGPTPKKRKRSSGSSPSIVSTDAITLNITEDQWWTLLGELQTICRSAIDQLAGDSPERLLAAGEIGAILAWQLPDLPSCASIREESLDAINLWYEAEGDAVAAALSDRGCKLRVVLGSAIRVRRLSARLKRRISIKRAGAAIDVATWVAATSRGDGSQMLTIPGTGVSDLKPGSLMTIAAQELGGPALQSAVDATLGKTKTGGRIAWQVELPEPAWFDDDAGLAVMLPEWDVRRGRMAVSYKNADRKTQIEISGGKHILAAGVWDARIWRSDKQLQPTSDWQDLCWHTDDDGHYLELEQVFEGNVKLQRQILMLRDDRCLMLADAVIGAGDDEVRFETEFPLATSVHVEEERETREVLLVDGKVRAMMMPLAMSEWKVGPTMGSLRIVDRVNEETELNSLSVVAEVRGKGAVYSPLWLDFDRKRIRQQRTWRRLTIGQKLRLVDPNEASAFRVQSGHDQWIMYRSLNGQHNRTFLGKNLISEFFCGRFDAEDGSIEELVSVDEQND